MVALICTGCGSDWPSLHDSLIAIGLIIGIPAIIAYVIARFFL